MGRKVRSYTQEYKNTIVDLFNNGKTYAEISSEYGVPKTTIRQWFNKANNTDDNTNTANENDAEIKAIKKRMAKLEQENNILDKEILNEYAASKRRYGAPKIHKILENKGFSISLKRVQKRMKKLDIKSIVVKKWKPSCQSSNKTVQKENILKGDFTAETVNKNGLLI